MNKGQAIDIAILQLALPDNKTKDFDFYKLAQTLNFPEEIQLYTFQTMFHRGYIDGSQTINNPIIHITKKGLQYAEELKEKYFQEHGKPLNPINTINMILNETCERLFQMHKNENYRIVWTKSTYDNEPTNLDVAKELLLNKNIIYQKVSQVGHKYTYLNPDFFYVPTYKEALEKINETNKAISSIIVDKSVTTYGNNSPVSGRDLTFNQSPNDNEKTKVKSWYKKLWEEIQKPLFKIIAYVIIGFISGLSIIKTCTPIKKENPKQMINSDKTDSASHKKLLKK